MARKAKAATADRIVETAVDLAAAHGWRGLTPSKVAEATGIGLDEMRHLFPTKDRLLCAFGELVDRRVLADGPASMEETPKDRLFELLMRRFDVLANHRQGILAILEDLRADPVGALCQAPRLELSMKWMLEAAGLRTDGLAGLVRIKALAAIYLLVLREWTRDDSPDMARTMRVLDERLSQAERWATSLGRRGPGSRRPRHDEVKPAEEAQRGNGAQEPEPAG